MHSHHFASRMPDWRAAAISGCIAGLVFLLLELFTMSILGQSPWGAPRIIVAIALSRDVLSLPATFGFGIIFVGLIVHFVLSVIFVLVLAVIIAPFSLDSSMGLASLAGAVFGVALYLVNFYGMSHLFPWLPDARSWASFVSHIVFGLVAADTYLWLETKEEAGVRGGGANS
ncbi:hypothetical protein [Paraburkholderia hospita]|uniref:Uncharacterized protein n=1 Tax=Paraburkholderia hospita TaxID=169430 RepID=A0AAJ5B903_9BURK|nr:hypothetical protein [Paraburkholderia hospita]AUT76549.1 hypothetical protein C2L64_51305 [Paraburkholderia hospita]AXF05951.1 hypothetical protein CUJ88_47160 [Paraburkholderia hospita]SEI22070.1 hypothetical protein SAMN05192544_104242 [Paraburkholderia hospita]